jgi:hypothetical protein
MGKDDDPGHVAERDDDLVRSSRVWRLMTLSRGVLVPEVAVYVPLAMPASLTLSLTAVFPTPLALNRAMAQSSMVSREVALSLPRVPLGLATLVVPVPGFMTIPYSTLAHRISREFRRRISDRINS